MAKKCKSNEIFFPPKNACVPKVSSISLSNTDLALYGIGAGILGGAIGWLLGNRDEGNRHPHDLHERNEILEYDMAEFIPRIDSIDFGDLSEDDIAEINDGITIGTVKRLESVYDEDEYNNLYTDLDKLKDFIENESQQEDSVSEVSPIVNHIQDLLTLMNHFDDVNEMIEYLAGKWQ